MPPPRGRMDRRRDHHALPPAYRRRRVSPSRPVLRKLPRRRAGHHRRVAPRRRGVRRRGHVARTGRNVPPDRARAAVSLGDQSAPPGLFGPDAQRRPSSDRSPPAGEAREGGGPQSGPGLVRVSSFLRSDCGRPGEPQSSSTSAAPPRRRARRPTRPCGGAESWRRAEARTEAPPHPALALLRQGGLAGGYRE